MEFECKLKPIIKIENEEDLKGPLCSKCFNAECTNPIVDKKISLFGVIHSTKLYKANNTYYSVTECNGFQEVEDENVFDYYEDDDE